MFTWKTLGVNTMLCLMSSIKEEKHTRINIISNKCSLKKVK